MKKILINLVRNTVFLTAIPLFVVGGLWALGYASAAVDAGPGPMTCAKLVKLEARRAVLFTEANSFTLSGYSAYVTSAEQVVAAEAERIAKEEAAKIREMNEARKRKTAEFCASIRTKVSNAVLRVKGIWS